MSGSTRSHSGNGIILRSIAEQFSDQATFDVFEALDALPHFNPELEGESLPATVSDFYKRIEQAAAILICTPEYVFSMPGVLKNALEWTVATTLLSYKPMAFIVASSSGVKTMESLDLVLETLKQEPIPDSHKLLVQSIGSKILPDRKTVEPLTNETIKTLVKALLADCQTID
ncbi:MAG: NADPH-dependent FMN reductase [Bacteroidota bacterium]